MLFSVVAATKRLSDYNLAHTILYLFLLVVLFSARVAEPNVLLSTTGRADPTSIELLEDLTWKIKRTRVCSLFLCYISNLDILYISTFLNVVYQNVVEDEIIDWSLVSSHLPSNQ